MLTKAYVGIDPGKAGAACLLAPDKIHFHDWESAWRSAKTLAEWRAEYEIVVGLEKVTSFKTDGHAFAFRFGVNYGIWQGICAGLCIDPVLVHSTTWQSAYLPGWNKKEVDNKKTAIETARRLHPIVKKKAICLKKHNGRADALLIADFLKGRGF